MKSKLTKKLFLYISLILISFSLINAGVFLFFGQKSINENFDRFLLQRAQSIADSISNNQNIFSTEKMMEESSIHGKRASGQRRGMPGPGYIKWLNEAMGSQIWIIDKDLQGVEVGQNQEIIDIDGLSIEQKEIISTSLFKGREYISHSFQSKDQDNLRTAIVPIQNQGDTLGVLLLHEDSKSMEEFASTAQKIFFLSSLIAIVSGLFLAVIFANRFIHPIKEIDKQAKELSQGNYDYKVQVKQEDEIGTLAQNMNTLSQKLDKAKKDSQALEGLKRDFISNISHELKTPVTVMKSSVEALSLGMVEEEDKDRYYKVLLEESSVLERLIQDLMELSMLQNTNFTIGKEEVNLIHILRDAIRSQRLLAKEKEINIKEDIKDRDIACMGDYTRLRQMFITVINNAIKFSQSDLIFIRQDSNEKEAWIEVENWGQSIAKEEVNKIFYSFYRQKETREKGFGLGLAIAKEIAQRHKIEIQVESQEEKKVVFRFIMDKTGF